MPLFHQEINFQSTIIQPDFRQAESLPAGKTPFMASIVHFFTSINKIQQTIPEPQPRVNKGLRKAYRVISSEEFLRQQHGEMSLRSSVHSQALNASGLIPGEQYEKVAG
jgi:hypothetical protein